MKILNVFLPLLFAPILVGAVVSKSPAPRPVFIQNQAFSAPKSLRSVAFAPKLEARLAAFSASSEPSEDEKRADKRAVRSFIFGILGIGFLVMLPTWLAIFCFPLLLLAFFNGVSAIKKTYRRGLATTGIVLGSLIWVGVLLMIFVLLLNF